jgi:membrane protease YdiL (CAAX protease family)
MRALGPWASFAFAFLAFVLGAAMGAAVVFVTVTGLDQKSLDSDGTATAIYLLVSNPVQIVTLVLAARISGARALEYLGLDIPRWRDISIAVLALAVAVAAVDAASFAFGKEIVPAFQIELHRTAQADGTLPWLLLAIIVAAPAGEELLFRGFLFRGFVHEARDAWPAIILIALMWTVLHLQYDWFARTQVFAIGVLFGFVRWRTGSTTLAILMHMLLNLESTVETVIVMGWV